MIRLVPSHFGAIAGMGHCLTELSELTKALCCYRQSLAINPRMPAISSAVDPLEHKLHVVNNSSGDFRVDTILS